MKASAGLFVFPAKVLDCSWDGKTLGEKAPEVIAPQGGTIETSETALSPEFRKVTTMESTLKQRKTHLPENLSSRPKAVFAPQLTSEGGKLREPRF